MEYTYTESVIHRKSVPGGDVIKYALLALAAMSLIMGLFLSFFYLIFAVVFGVLYYLATQNFDVEFEYIHTNDVFDIDKVLQGNARKSVMSIELNKVVLVAPEGSAAAEDYEDLKARDFTDKVTKENRYVMVCVVKGEQVKLLLQLDPKMRKSLKRWMPGKIVEN